MAYLTFGGGLPRLVYVHCLEQLLLEQGILKSGFSILVAGKQSFFAVSVRIFQAPW